MSNIGKLLMMVGIVFGFIYLSQFNSQSIGVADAPMPAALYLSISAPVFALGLYFYFRAKRLFS
ncbi:hypothetical protein B0I21_101188 [Sphingobacterium paludis]|uniref:Uncharacterized protein n=1 Tax=Sphingobacterium paludis TaxID=1476465 RepID=A0A4R7DBP6_9SPHI|nr:hypothetical protein B0I21_101188 [Sphingobacterium paludis]